MTDYHADITHDKTTQVSNRIMSTLIAVAGSFLTDGLDLWLRLRSGMNRPHHACVEIGAKNQGILFRDRSSIQPLDRTQARDEAAIHAIFSRVTGANWMNDIEVFRELRGDK